MRRFSFLTRTALLLGFFFALDKVLAFVRSLIIARTFRLSFELDAFNVANNLPDLLFALISGGALAMAFIPVLTQTLTLRGRQAAWDLFSRVANLAFVITASLALIIALFAEPIVRSEIGIAPGFAAEKQHLIAELMRLNLVATLLFSISGLVMAGLQANQHFFLPALAPALYNIGQIFGALVLAPRFGVRGLVYGVILGAALHLLVQVPALIRYQFRWTPSLQPDPAVIETLKVIGPRLLTMFLIQSMFIVRDNLASRLEQVGAISALTYGWMIMQVPETLLGTAIATAMLPTLSQLAARRAWDEFRATLERALRVLIALTLPMAAVLAAGIGPLIRAAFGFDAQGSNLLTWTARAYLLTLCGYALQEVAVRSFYARKEAWYPFFGVLIRMALYIGMALFALLALRSIGAPAIALAELSLTIEAVLLFAWLGYRMRSPLRLGNALLHGLVAAGVGGGATLLLAIGLPGNAILTSGAGMIGGAALAWIIVRREAHLIFHL